MGASRGSDNGTSPPAALYGAPTSAYAIGFMSPRLMILCLATVLAGICAWWAWPREVREGLEITPRALVPADVDRFVAACRALAADHEAQATELPRRVDPLEFAVQMARRPGRLAAGCARAGIPVAEFLGIAAALGYAERRDAAWRRFEAETEARAAREALLAEALAAAGFAVSPVEETTVPPAIAALPEADRRNIEVYRGAAEAIRSAWVALVGAAPERPPRRSGPLSETPPGATPPDGAGG